MSYAKSHGHNSGLHTPLLVAKALWKYVSMDFVLGLPRSSRNKDSIIMVVDCLSKIMHFVSCSKTLDATNIINLYFNEIVRLHGIPKTITSYRNSKFMSHFLCTL
jgi:hypothetical protein